MSAARPSCAAVIVWALAPVLVSLAPECPGTSDRLAPVKAAYFYDTNGSGHVHRIAQAGFNTALVKFSEFGRQRTADLVDFSNACAADSIQFIPTLNFAGGNESEVLETPAGRTYVSESGTVFEAAPCPLDTLYWRRVVADRIGAIAELARTTPIRGVAVDLELYAAGLTQYSNYGCYDDRCFASFDSGLDDPAALDYGERFKWLQRHGRLASYVSHIADRVTKLCETIRGEIRQVNPDLLLGLVVPDETNWFSVAVARGLAMKTRPVVVFSEATYDAGFLFGRMRVTDRLYRNINGFVMVWGLDFSRLTPESILSSGRRFLQRDAGYWVYTTHSLTLPEAKRKGIYQLRGSPEEYWDALEQIAAGHDSSIFKKPSSSDAPAGLLEFLAESADSSPRSISLRGTHRIVVDVQTRLELRLVLRPIWIASHLDKVRYVLFSSEGVVVDEAEMAVGEGEHVSETNVNPGRYEIYLETGSNACTLELSVPFAIHAPVHLFRTPSTMYFTVPANMAEFSVTLTSPGRGEGVRVAIVDPGGEVLVDLSGEVDEPRDIQLVSAPDQRDQYWEIQLRKPADIEFEDVFLRLDEHLPQFVGVGPERSE